MFFFLFFFFLLLALSLCRYVCLCWCWCVFFGWFGARLFVKCVICDNDSKRDSARNSYHSFDLIRFHFVSHEKQKVKQETFSGHKRNVHNCKWVKNPNVEKMNWDDEDWSGDLIWVLSTPWFNRVKCDIINRNLFLLSKFSLRIINSEWDTNNTHTTHTHTEIETFQWISVWSLFLLQVDADYFGYNTVHNRIETTTTKQKTERKHWKC